MADKVEVTLEVLVKEALATVSKFADTTQRQLDGINFNTSVTAIRAGFEMVRDAATYAFNAVEGFASKAIEESLQAEEANLALSNSLRLAGDYSAEAVANFDQLAQSIQSTTKFTADAVKSSIGLAKQYRLTNSESERAIRVAADLAAVQGISLNDATQKVAQTFNGFVDRSLAKAIPELKNLTKESLIAGNAVEIIRKRVEGSAEAVGNTFSGAVFQAKESANDLLEGFGNLITQNPAVIAGIKEIQKAFVQLGVEFGKNSAALRKVVTEGFLFLVESIPSVVSALKFVDEIISNAVVGFYSLGRAIGAVIAALASFSTGDFEGAKTILTALTTDTTESFKQNADRISKFYTPIINTTKDLAANIRKVSESAKQSSKEIKNIGASTSGVGARLADNFNIEEFKKKIETIAKEPLRFAFEAAVKRQEITRQQGIAIGAGLVSNILKGAEGAKKLLQEAVGAVADFILPGIGGAVSEIVGVLSQGPAKVKEMISQFVLAIPDLINSLVESLPILISELAAKLPPALAKTFPFLAERFAIEMVKNMPTIIRGFVVGMIEAAKQFAQTLFKTISSFGGLFGGGGGKGGIGGFLDKLNPFAEGGRIPDLPQYQGDRFPARLNAGEQVFSRDLSNRLENYLNSNGNSGAPQVVSITIGQRELARVLLDLNRNGFRTA